MTGDLHIIAEAGTNHNGSVQLAGRLVRVAASSGANSVKFQIIYPQGLYLPQMFNQGRYIDNEVFQKRAATMLSDDEYREVAELCRKIEIPFAASVFDLRGIDLLDQLDTPYFKIASCDLNNSHLLKQAAERGRRMVISTGMASLEEIDRAVSDVASTGNSAIVLMHCVSVYPCELAKMNLSFLNVLKVSFGFPVGISDHTEGSLAGAMSLALGAEWIEKHLTLDRTMEGFDHEYAIEPAGFAQFVCDMKACHQAAETQYPKTGLAEQATKKRARRALYASRDINEGEVVTERDILIVRPEGPLQPNDLKWILDREARRPVSQYEPITLDMF
jgi:N,N'-diacetyllegionaminate synthase